MINQHIALAVIIALSILASAYAQSESTYISVIVREDGSAKWVVEHAYPLKNDEEVEAFEAVASNVSKELSEAYIDRLVKVIQDASRLSGREMSLTDFIVNSSIHTTATGAFAKITIEFVWSGFAAVGGRQHLCRRRIRRRLVSNSWRSVHPQNT